MPLVTVNDYLLRVGDAGAYRHDDIEAALTQAQDLVDDWCGRFFEMAERTEVLPIARNGTVYPTAVPVTGTSDASLRIVHGGYAIDDATPDAQPFVAWDDDRPPTKTVTYSGGYTSVTLPETVRRAIVHAAKSLLERQANAVTLSPAGATSVRVGDVAVTYGPQGAPAHELDSVARGMLRRYRRKGRTI